MSSNRHRNSAEVERQIDIALGFISAVQHLTKYHRLGLDLATALREAAEPNFLDSGDVDGSQRETSESYLGETFVGREMAEPEPSVITNMADWRSRMAMIYNDGEPWPHPHPAGGWGGNLS